MAMFTVKDLGCIIDGVRGHAALRTALAIYMDHLALRSSYGSTQQRIKAAKLRDELRAEMSDDASEENEAISLLNELTTDRRVMLELVDGDLMCVARGYCIVVRDRFGQMHAETFDPSSECAPDAAKELVERLGLNDTPGERFEWATVAFEDPGAARLWAWADSYGTWAAGATETGSFES